MFFKYSLRFLSFRRVRIELLTTLSVQPWRACRWCQVRSQAGAIWIFTFSGFAWRCQEPPIVPDLLTTTHT
uniref:Uncharacterized protein n=1 Tax=Pararge aegeria TaxID=116150 RepID=S4NZY3_9NEOP